MRQPDASIRYLPQGKPSGTLLVYMHPSSTLQLLPMPRAMAGRGMHVLCAASRYARNDTPLIFEKVVLDLGAKPSGGLDRLFWSWLRESARANGIELAGA